MKHIAVECMAALSLGGSRAFGLHRNLSTRMARVSVGLGLGLELGARFLQGLARAILNDVDAC